MKPEILGHAVVHRNKVGKPVDAQLAIVRWLPDMEAARNYAAKLNKARLEREGLDDREFVGVEIRALEDAQP